MIFCQLNLSIFPNEEKLEAPENLLTFGSHLLELYICHVAKHVRAGWVKPCLLIYHSLSVAKATVVTDLNLKGVRSSIEQHLTSQMLMQMVNVIGVN